MIGVPLIPWPVLTALWELRGLIGFAVLGLYGYFWLCRRQGLFPTRVGMHRLLISCR